MEYYLHSTIFMGNYKKRKQQIKELCSEILNSNMDYVSMDTLYMIIDSDWSNKYPIENQSEAFDTANYIYTFILAQDSWTLRKAMMVMVNYMYLITYYEDSYVSNSDLENIINAIFDYIIFRIERESPIRVRKMEGL